MKTSLQRLKIDIFAVLSFLIPLYVYLCTAPRTITGYGDSAGLITLAEKFQTAHPPGYPLFILLGKLFSYIPIGSMAFRLSIMSSLLGSITVFFIYKILKILFIEYDKKLPDPHLGRRNATWIIDLSALLGSLSLAFVYSLWLYAITPEVFVLNNLIAVAIVYLTANLVSATERLNFKLYLIFFLFGLGLSNHMTIVLLIPPVFLYIFLNGFVKSFKNLKIGLFAFLFGLTPYLLVFINSYFPHYPIYGNTPGIDRFLEYVTRSDYGGILSGGTKESVPVGDGPASMVVYFFKTLLKSYFYLPLIGAVYFIYKKSPIYRSKDAMLSYIAILTGIIFPIYSLWGLGVSDLHSKGVAERFGLLGFLFVGIVLLAGIFQFFTNILPRIFPDRLHKHLNENRGKSKDPLPTTNMFILPVIFLFITTSFLVLNFHKVNKRDYKLAYNFGLNILNQVENGSIIFTSDDLTSFALFYLTQSEKIKPDIKIIGSGFLSNINYQKELKTNWPDLFDTDSQYSYDIARDIIKVNREKGVYFASIDDPYPYGFLGNPYYLTPQGLLLKADEKTTAGDLIPNSKIDHWENYDYRGLEKDWQDAFAQLTVYYYSFKAKINSQVYINGDCRECADREIEFASKYIGNKDKLTSELSKTKKEETGDAKSAKSLLDLAKGRFAKGGLTQKDFDRTAWDLLQAEKLDPKNAEIQGGLGEIFEMLKVFPLSYERYKNAARLDPQGGWEESMLRVKDKI